MLHSVPSSQVNFQHTRNVHEASCIILHFKHYDPRSATQNARSSPHAIVVFHHRDHAQPTQSTAERHSKHRKTHEPSSSTRAQFDPVTQRTTVHTALWKRHTKTRHLLSAQRAVEPSWVRQHCAVGDFWCWIGEGVHPLAPLSCGF